MKQPVNILKGEWNEVVAIIHAHAKRAPFRSRLIMEHNMLAELRDNFKVFIALQDTNLVGYLLTNNDNQVYILSGQTEEIKEQLAKEIKP